MPEAPLFATDPDAPWLYLHTSGSTGTPKYIGLSQDIVRRRSKAVESDFPFRATTFGTYYEPTSRPFFARGLAALLQACAIVESKDPAFWRRCGVNLVAASPIQVIRAFGDTPLVPKIARVEIGGARIPDGEAKRLLQSFETVQDVYGASETSKSFASELSLDEAGELMVTGTPLDSEVEIVDGAGRPVAGGMIGEVRVRNPYMVAGYIGDAAATARAFRDGWFYPGDLARWTERGALQIIGRQDDVINLGGHKIYGSLLDGLLESVPGVKAAIVLRNPIPGATHMILAFVVYADAEKVWETNEAIIDLVWARLGYRFSMRSIRPIDAVPLDAKGSPDRRVCEQMVLAKAAEWGDLVR